MSKKQSHRDCFFKYVFLVITFRVCLRDTHNIELPGRSNFLFPIFYMFYDE